MASGLREPHKKQRFDHKEIGTISLEGTPIDEKPDALVEYVENNNNRSKPVTPAPKSEASMRTDALPEGIEETEDEKKEQWFVGAIDQGTTSTRFLIFNPEGEPVANKQIEFDNLYPNSG